MMLGATGVACADSYTCNEGGNPPPASVSGDADISESGSCTLDSTITASGYITVTAGDSVNIQGLSAGGSITVEGTSVTASDSLSAGGALMVTSDGTIDTVALSGSSINVNSAGADATIGGATASGGTLTLQAQSTATATGALSASGNVVVKSTDSDVSLVDATSTGGTLTIEGQTNVTATGNLAASTTASINSDDGDITTKDVTTFTGTLDITAADSVHAQKLSAGGKITITSGTTLDTGDIVTYGGSGGDIELDPGDTVTVNSMSADGGVSALLSNGGDMVVTQYVNAFTNPIDLEADKITVGGNIYGVQSVTLFGSEEIKVTGFTWSVNDFVSMEGTNLEDDDVIIAGTYVKAIANDDSIVFKSSVTSNAADGNGDILLQAQNNVQTGNISTNGSAGNGFVEIDANLAGGSSEFIVGGSENSNGVNGIINTSTDDGGGTLNNFVHGGVLIVNGTSGSTGGITITDGSNIYVDATASRSGLIILNAQAGTFTLGGGVLEAGGPNAYAAGGITIAAHAVDVSATATIRAMQSSSSGGTAHGVEIAASTVTYGGTLTISSDGDGLSTATTSVQLIPTGAVTISSDANVENGIFVTTTEPNGTFNTNAPISYSGPALIVTADGSYNAAAVSGNGMTFAGGSVIIQSKGATNHFIEMYYGSYGGDLTFGGSGAVFLNADATTGGTGGTVGIYAKNAVITTPSTFTMSANGPSSGDGNGGVVDFESISLSSGSTTIGKLSANGASSGTGNGGTITWYPGTAEVKLGTNAGDYSLTTNSGTTDGDAGSITVNPNPGNVSIETINAISTKVLGTNGIGGNVTIIANPSVMVDSSITGLIITADGKGTGSGGDVTIDSSTDVDLSGITEELITAKGGDSGDGGKIYITKAVPFDFLTVLNVESGDFGGCCAVAAKPRQSLHSRDSTGFDGVIGLNLQNCREYKKASSWPKRYWNCTPTQDSETALDSTPYETAANSVYDSLRTTFSDNKVEILVFRGYEDYNKFYKGSTATFVNGGETKKIDDHIIVNAWESGAVADTKLYDPYDTAQEAEVTAHELGHALDIIIGNNVPANFPSTSASFSRAVNRDIYDLDYILDPTTSAYIPRLPCKATVFSDNSESAETPPFSGVIYLGSALSDKHVCTASGDLSADFIDNNGTPFPNDTIVLNLEPGLFNTGTPNFATPWIELHAQIFSYTSFGNLGGRPQLDKVIDNGAMKCTRTWAFGELGGNNGVTLPNPITAPCTP